MEETAIQVQSTALVAFEPALSAAAQPIALPVPAGAVKVLPRWSVEDGVLRWRLRYRPREPDEQDLEGADGNLDHGAKWVEIELRSFTRELPLADLQVGVQHYFTVAVETPEGWSSWSPIAVATPPAPELPGKCAAVYANVKDLTTAIVHWTRPIDFAAVHSTGVQRYKLLVTWSEIGPDGAPIPDATVGKKEVPVDEDTDVWEVGDLECLRDYTFQVAAGGLAGWGEWSDPSPKLNMPPLVPHQLQQPTLRRATHHSVVIQWQHPVDKKVGIDSFRFRWTTSQDWKSDVHEQCGVSATLSQHVIEGLTAGETYIFQVSALNKYGKSIWSESSLPVKTLDAHEPSKITQVDIPEKYRSFITLRWAPAVDNGFEVTRHVVRYGNKPDMSDAKEVEPTVERKNGADCCNLRHLKREMYYFQVAAYNKMGMSEWSDPIGEDLSGEVAVAGA